MMASFVSSCIKRLAIFTSGAAVTNRFVMIVPVILSVIGFVASYFYFWKRQSSQVWYWLMLAVSILGIFRALYTLYAVAKTVVFSIQYISGEIALNAVLTVCIYLLFCYQAHMLCVRRKMAKL